MKKIQIVTFHWTVNYGGLLQAYSLQENIKKMGFEPVFLNYYNKKECLASLSIFKRIVHFIYGNCVKFILCAKQRERVTKRFRKEYLNIDKKKCRNIRDAEAVSKGYHAFITGSDQVWNSDITGNPNIYLLKHAPDGASKTAYAASFGKPVVSDKYRKNYVEEIGKFSKISVREESGAEIVKDLIGISPRVVLDPVFLLSRKEWAKIESEQLEKEEYVLCYYLPSSDESVMNAIKNTAQILAHENKCKVINIGKRDFGILNFNKNDLFNVGPCEFISLISHAKCVVTNSFHGTAFSIITQVPFYVPVNNSVPKERRISTRVECLLVKFRLEDRIVRADDFQAESVLEMKEIDFSYAEEKIVEMQKSSLAFLKESLEVGGSINEFW